MNRRHFLRASAVIATVGAVSRRSLFAQMAQGPDNAATTAVPRATGATGAGGFVPLRRQVGIFNGRGGTIGWLSTKDALAVVDTQFPDTARQCLAGLTRNGTRKIDVVINTHHHADHTSGNPVFRPVAKTMVAHKNVPGLQRAAAGRTTPPSLDKQVYADSTFEDTWSLALPGPRGADETLRARHFGPAHTGGDIAVHFENANIVHMGDLVFNRLYPVIDRVGGASLMNWINVLETAHKYYPADAIYVFGHGNPAPNFGVTGTRDDILVMRDYLTGVLEYVRNQIALGKSRAEIITLENLPGFTDYHLPVPNRLGGNLGVAYDELTGARQAS